MNAENTAGRVLRQLIYGAPQACDVQIAMVQSDDEEVRLLGAQKVDDGLYLVAFDQMGVQLDSGLRA